MKVLFNCLLPFSLAHGGMTIQIQQTKKALEECGVEVEYMRWWDEEQTGDIVHFFGRPPAHFMRLAQAKGMKIVVMELLTGQGSRAPWKHWLHRWAIRLLPCVTPATYRDKIPSAPYKLADAALALTPYEAGLLQSIFQAPAAKTFVIPNGIEPCFFLPPPAERTPWLVCTAAITPRKRVMELAQAAVLAGTPLWIIGAPYSSGDPYFTAFTALLKAHPDMIRYEGGISDRNRLAHIYNTARGFVLLSTMESRSLSAEEAAAASVPSLLSDLPWAHSVFGENARYAPVNASPAALAAHLRRFYDEAPTLRFNHKPATWPDVAREIIAIYRSILK